MYGRDVVNAQAVLTRFGTLASATHDGVYGPVTANAAKRAKYLLGYAAGRVDGLYGPQLAAYANGEAQPTLAMRARIKQRKRKPVPKVSIGASAADLMVAWYEARWHEQPIGSNVVEPLSLLAKDLHAPRDVWLMRYPWCSLAVFTAALKFGSAAAKSGLVRGEWNALYTPDVEAQARAGTHGLRAISKPSIVRGSIVLFDFSGHGVQHVGYALAAPGKIVFAGGQRWSATSTQVITVEGNTSYEGKTGSQSDGGCVAIRCRNLADIRTVAYVS